MTLRTLITRSLRYYWRTNLAVAAGVAVATAVLVGSLLVGDSVNGSLHDLALGRIGHVQQALTSQRFFRESLVDDLRERASLDNDAVTPALMLDAAARYTDPESDPADPRTVVVPQVTLYGVEDAFWQMSGSDAGVKLSGREAAVNRHLADALGIKTGDEIECTVPRSASAPVESVFGRRDRDDTIRSVLLTVKAVIPDAGAGKFTLRSDRPRPRNVFVPLDGLQRALWYDEKPVKQQRVNTVFISSTADVDNALAASLTLDDYDLELVTPRTPPVYALRSKRLVLSPKVVATVDKTTSDRLYGFHESVYLANVIRRTAGGGTGGVPYSLLGIWTGPKVETMKSDDIILIDWAANDLGVKGGDNVTCEFYIADVRGQLHTTTRTFTVKAVVPLEKHRYHAYVPEFEGMTDTKDMGDWDPPFPIDTKAIRPKDERYWDDYQTTPKGYISADAMRALWIPEGVPEDVTGWITGMTLMPLDQSPHLLIERFKADLLRRLAPVDAGFEVRPVRAEALATAKTPTDFASLFLSMSFFLVAAAAGLIWLLLRLTIDRRASQIGILLATGFTQTSAARVIVREALLVAVVGVLAGVPLGIAYAGGIIAALTSNWRGAVADFPLALHVTWTSLVIGAVSGLVVSALALILSSRLLRKLTALELLSGWQAIAAAGRKRVSRVPTIIGVASLGLAAALLILWGALDLVPAPAAFGAGGGLLLVGLLALLSGILQRRAQEGVSAAHLSLARLSLRGASRHWVRSLLTVGLLAAASLLVVTVAAFRNDPSQTHPGPKGSGTGGFNLLARSDIPVFADLNTAAGRKKLRFSKRASDAMQHARVYPFRESRGGDISCLNLQVPKTPRVLGVPSEMIARGGFSFAKHLPTDVPEGNLWRMLDAPGDNNTIPAFADAATAQWQLKTKLGDVITVPTPAGGEVKLRIVGWLSGSVFAGELLVSESNFTPHFGTDGGYRFLLVECDEGAELDVTAALRASLGDIGYSVERTTDVLAAYLEVQNTYLGAFETLGGLGLLLATFGIVTVLLRSVIERRAELAMMLAVGFRRTQVVSVVLMENALLLVMGIVIGTVSALVAAGPQLFSKAADVRWPSLALTLGSVVAVGLVSCAVASAASVGRELIAALRSE